MTLDSDSGAVEGDRPIKTHPPNPRELPIPSSLTLAFHFRYARESSPLSARGRIRDSLEPNPCFSALSMRR
jgi:hypothetical protein